jgi:hypothetical protein
MRQVKVTPVRNVVHRVAVIACVAILGVGAAACGSTSNTDTPKAPTPTTVGSPVSTPPTTAPKSGGAGF